MGRSKKPTGPMSLYSVHPGVAMVQKWIRDLPEKTGRTLDEWLTYIAAEGPQDEKARRAWLKEHGLGTNTAWWLAERAGNRDVGLAEEDPERYLAEAPAYVDAMLAGPKAALRPLYDELLRVCLAIGQEAKACPCKTIVPIYRNHVIAQIKPTTRTRLDLGLALGEIPVTGGLIDTGGLAKKERITHRLAVSSPADINDEMRRWLQIAYDRDA